MFVTDLPVRPYKGVSQSFWTELIMKYMLTFGITR